MYLLASLPDSFNTLVTALEANEDVPKMEVVTERLPYAERKRREKDLTAEQAMTATKGCGPKCFNCKKVFTHSETLSRIQQVHEDVELQDKVEG